MMVSTKGRYALRVMIDLAQQGGAGYIPLKDIAQRQGLSEKYLESIVKLLARNGDLAGVPGAQGLLRGGDPAPDGGKAGPGKLSGAGGAV